MMAFRFAMSRIGRIYDVLGVKTKALQYYNQARPMFRQLGNIVGEAANLNNIAWVHYSLGDKTQALEFLNQALPLSRQARDVSGEADVLDKRAFALRDVGQPAEAITSFRAAAACHQRRNPPDHKEAAE